MIQGRLAGVTPLAAAIGEAVQLKDAGLGAEALDAFQKTAGNGSAVSI